MKWWMYFLPGRFFYADHLTTSARRLLSRLGVAALGGVIAIIALALATGSDWTGVVSGALLAWATSFVAWAVSSYRDSTDDTIRELRDLAELDLLHARLNQLAHRLGVPSLDLSSEIEAVLQAREERLAHFAGLDEFRAEGYLPGAAWWDQIALGLRSEE